MKNDLSLLIEKISKEQIYENEKRNQNKTKTGTQYSEIRALLRDYIDDIFKEPRVQQQLHNQARSWNEEMKSIWGSKDENN